MLDGVTSLAAQSLIRQTEGSDGEPRFAMLETIREDALERLEASGEATAGRRRHAEHFLARAEEALPYLERPEAAAWLDRLQADHDNLRAALAWSSETDDAPDLMPRLAAPLWRFWWVRGHFAEGRRWLDRAVERATDASARIAALQGAASLAFYQADYPRARDLFAEILDVGWAHDDQVAVAWGLGRLGLITARQTGDYERAVALCDESLAVSRQLGDKQSIAHSSMTRAQVALGQGDYDRAEACWDECLRLAREIGHVAFHSHSLHLLATVASLRGDLDRAIALCNEAFALFRLRGDEWGELNCLQVMLRIAHLRADAQTAAVLARECLVRQRELGSRGGIPDVLSALAWVARVRADPARAGRLLGAGEALIELLGSRRRQSDRDTYESEVALARASLGDEAFAAAWAEGRAMTLEQAVAYALEESPSD